MSAMIVRTGMLGGMALLGWMIFTVATTASLERLLRAKYKWVVCFALVQDVLCGLSGLIFMLGSLIAVSNHPEMEIFFSTASALTLFGATAAMLAWGTFGVIAVWRGRHARGSLRPLTVFVVVLIGALVWSGPV